MGTTHLPAVNAIGLTAPFDWLAGGWADLCRAPGPCLAYGASLAAISMAFAAGLFLSGAMNWFLVLAAGFVLVAPMFAMGLYEAGSQLEQGKAPRMIDMFFVRSAFRPDLVYLGIGLVIIYSVWVEVALLTYGLSTSKIHRSPMEFLGFLFGDPAGRQMALVGTVIGGVIAFLAYALVVISAPMLLSRKTDVFTATITSVRSVTRNFLPMMVWALLIAALTTAGIATGFLGLVIVFPVIGLASWRAYRNLVPSSGQDIDPEVTVQGGQLERNGAA